MNKRIKELIEEAVTFRLDPDSNCHEAQVCPEDLEYLAELIIKDITGAITVLGADFLEEGKRGPAALCNSIVEHINEDYGVKE